MGEWLFDYIGSYKIGEIIMLSHADTYPSVQRLQGAVLFPYGILAAETGYSYNQIRVEDEGQNIEAIDWLIATQKALINRDCSDRIFDRFPIIFQTNAANGLYPDAGMKVWIANMIAESNRCTDLCEEATIMEAVLAISPAWPGFVEV